MCIRDRIRTPLNSIVGFSDVLAVGGSTEEEQQSYYQIIKTNSDLLLRLINDILDLSRLEANRVTLTWEECDMVQLSSRRQIYETREDYLGLFCE